MEKVKQETTIIKRGKNLFYFLLGLVLLRPSLNIIGHQEIQIHSSLPSFNINAVIGALVFFIGLFFLIRNIKTIKLVPLFWPIFFFIGFSFFSIFYSINSPESVREFIRVATIFLLYFLAYKLIQEERDWNLLLKFILISYIFPGVVAFGQFALGMGLPDEFGGFNRVYGTFNHPNPFAFYTFFILGIAIALILSQKKGVITKLDRNKLWILASPLVFLLFATYTRSALACLLIFIFILGILKYRKILLGGAFLFLIAYFLSNVFQQRLWELFTLDPYGSIVWRLRLWRDIMPISLWQPWFGYGIGTFNSLVEFYRGFEWGSLEAHNDYLKIFVENGIAGLVSYISLILGLLFYLFRIFKKSIEQEKTLALSILIISASLFIISFFDNILRTTALQWNFWILLGGWLKMAYLKKI